MKKAIRTILKILVARGDFETLQEAFDAHREDFVEMRDLIAEGDCHEAEELFGDVFGLEPDFFEPFVFAMLL